MRKNVFKILAVMVIIMITNQSFSQPFTQTLASDSTILDMAVAYMAKTEKVIRHKQQTSEKKVVDGMELSLGVLDSSFTLGISDPKGMNSLLQMGWKGVSIVHKKSLQIRPGGQFYIWYNYESADKKTYRISLEIFNRKGRKDKHGQYTIDGIEWRSITFDHGVLPSTLTSYVVDNKDIMLLKTVLNLIDKLIK
jgi:hypothetical protein